MAKKLEKARGRRGSAKKGAGRAQARPAGDSSAAAARGDRALRRHLVDLLRGGKAHLEFDQAVADLPAELRGAKPSAVQAAVQAALPYSVWRLVEHMRIAQRDILEFSRNPKHVSPEWPDGYWPQGDAPPDDAAWERCIKAFRADLKAMEELVTDPSTDLFRRIPHGDGQTILREALLVADHNAYHLGQIVTVRRLLGAWKQ